MTSDETAETGGTVISESDIRQALGDAHFKRFLDRMPVAIAVSECGPPEQIIYANREFDALAGRTADEILGRGWEQLDANLASNERTFGEAVAASQDDVSAFAMKRQDSLALVNVWSNLIHGEDGAPAFRLVALAEAGASGEGVVAELERRVVEKDTQLRELQHRVKNNLQMITALIRIEARGVTDRTTSEGFDRLAGRIEALGILYHALTESSSDEAIDLGVYLSEIAAAVMRAHAVGGIHLDLQVDTCLTPLDVAMPTGLVVNELLTNALKHAFRLRERGVITLHSTVGPQGCRIVVADDGVGLRNGTTWPKSGKLSALIVRSLEENAKAQVGVSSQEGRGTRVTITFPRPSLR
ncbi:MAG TPA: histidine kinase dimerization/phosphoacceptor domain -containing protein [Caulobacteraceae bacterium]|jgi:two-component sensor histidine kinase|nr:histidine kinase dimerization/phosphoacceptor domain -containing protein [Caulobacteraceae bacterium]